jgi:hypothetical protein
MQAMPRKAVGDDNQRPDVHPVRFSLVHCRVVVPPCVVRRYSPGLSAGRRRGEKRSTRSKRRANSQQYRLRAREIGWFAAPAPLFLLVRDVLDLRSQSLVKRLRNRGSSCRVVRISGNTIFEQSSGSAPTEVPPIVMMTTTTRNWANIGTGIAVSLLGRRIERARNHL